MSGERERIKGMEKNLADPLAIGINKKKTVAAAAPVAAPVAMPDADGEAVAAAKRRKAQSQQQRGGRQSTILADDVLGG